ncbi:hypothetical protein [Streptomyces sp. NPDC127112]|uniref:hypothetical protein n=1 Tax=Streptomyces sp. NPDC127112 TaxID=3345364 RepID=UPI003637FCCC
MNKLQRMKPLVKRLSNEELQQVSELVDEAIEGIPNRLGLHDDPGAAEILGDVVWNEMLDRGLDIFEGM